MNTILKSIIKSTVRLLAVVTVLPAVLMFRLQEVFTGANGALAGWSQLLSLIPGTIGVYLRHAFYRQTLSQCDEDVCISFGTIFSHASTSLGQSVYIGNYCSVGDASIEQDVLIASHVSIMNGCHQHGLQRLDIPVREQPGTYERITIGRDSWIGERATVAANVGRQCVIGAGAVVVSPIPDYAIAVGVPARIIGDRREIARTDNADHTTDKTLKNAEPAHV